jgi:hypothetical protein
VLTSWALSTGALSARASSARALGARALTSRAVVEGTGPDGPLRRVVGYGLRAARLPLGALSFP